MEMTAPIPLDFVVEALFFVLLFVFAIHSLFLGYHWFTFGTDRHTSMIALAVYLVGGAVLFITLAAARAVV